MVLAQEKGAKAIVLSENPVTQDGSYQLRGFSTTKPSLLDEANPPQASKRKHDEGHRPSIQAVDQLASSSEAIVGIEASSSASLPTPNVCKPPLQAPVFSFSAPSQRLTQYNKLGLVPREALPQPYPPQKKVCVRVPAQRKRKHHKPSAEQDESRYIYSNLAKKSATGQGLGPEQHRQPGSSSFRQAHCLDNIYQHPRPPDQT